MATTVRGVVTVEGGLVRVMEVTVAYVRPGMRAHVPGIHGNGLVLDTSTDGTGLLQESLVRAWRALVPSDFVDPGETGSYMVSFSSPDRAHTVADASSLDLAVAVALLVESGQAPADEELLSRGLFVGGLSPEGDVIPFRGADPTAEALLLDLALNGPSAPLAVIDAFPSPAGVAISALRHCGPGGDAFDDLVGRQLRGPDSRRPRLALTGKGPGDDGMLSALGPAFGSLALDGRLGAAGRLVVAPAPVGGTLFEPRGHYWLTTVLSALHDLRRAVDVAVTPLGDLTFAPGMTEPGPLDALVRATGADRLVLRSLPQVAEDRIDAMRSLPAGAYGDLLDQTYTSESMPVGGQVVREVARRQELIELGELGTWHERQADEREGRDEGGDDRAEEEAAREARPEDARADEREVTGPEGPADDDGETPQEEPDAYTFELPTEVIASALAAHGIAETTEAISTVANDLVDSDLDEILCDRAASYVNDYVHQLLDDWDPEELGFERAGHDAPSGPADPPTAASLIESARKAPATSGAPGREQGTRRGMGV